MVVRAFLKKPQKNSGFALTEVILAMVILLVATLGALSYEYHAASQNKTASTDLIAIRTAQLLLEDWKSTGGASEYDPTSLPGGFATIDDEDAEYIVTIDDLPIYVTLSYDDIGHDDVTGITLRQINVFLSWRRDGQEGPRTQSDPTLTLSTYVRTDASGG